MVPKDECEIGKSTQGDDIVRCYCQWNNCNVKAIVQEYLNEFNTNTTTTSVGIFPGTFPIFKSRDFWTSLVPGQRDHGTFKVFRSCPVLSRDLGPLVPGLPGTSRDLFGRLFEKRKSIQRCMFFYICNFFSQIAFQICPGTSR